MRRAVAVALVAASLAVASVCAAAPASAHAEVEGTTPRNGAVVRSAPAEVTVRFGEDVTLESARLLGPGGSTLASTASVAGDVLTVRPAATLPGGPITVAWQVRSDDGHPVSGAIAFVVGRPPATGRPQSLAAFPHVPVRLSGSRPGPLTVTLGTRGVGSEIEWTSPTLPEPITWRLTRDGTVVAGRGVLPTPGTWSFTATVVKKNGAVVVVTGTATLRPGAS